MLEISCVHVLSVKHMSSSTEGCGTFEGCRPSQKEERHMNPLFTLQQSCFLLQLSLFAKTTEG